MDLVDHQESYYQKVVQQFEEVASKLLIKDIRFIPISALNGDNVVNRSERMTWYQGAPLLHVLEHLHISSDFNKVDPRFPVQTVLRPQREGFIDYRGYAGRVASGIFRPGDAVVVRLLALARPLKQLSETVEKLMRLSRLCPLQ